MLVVFYCSECMNTSAMSAKSMGVAAVVGILPRVVAQRMLQVGSTSRTLINHLRGERLSTGIEPRAAAVHDTSQMLHR